VLEAQAEGGAAFLVFHLGQDGDDHLVDWWSDRDILNQRLFHRAPAEGRFREIRHESWVACVWELQIFEAERRHWTETTMSGRPQDHRGRHLEDGIR